MLACLVCVDKPHSSSFATTMALYQNMLDPQSGFQPILICPEAPEQNHIRPDGLLNMFRIWRWQRKQEEILLVGIGAKSLKLARRIYKMRKKGTTRLVSICEASQLQYLQVKDLEQVSLFICDSQYACKQLQIMGQTNCIAVEPGLNLEKYEEMPRNVASTERFVFGMAESLQSNSGALLLIRAMSALWQHDDLPPWEARLFGGGPRFEEIMAEAEKLGVLSRLAILGSQELPDVLPYCHAWLAPGKAPIEKPATLWAGFAAELPVICSTSELHRERLPHPAPALEVSCDNPQELARAILLLMRDKNKAHELALSGSALKPQICLSAMAERIRAAIANS